MGDLHDECGVMGIYLNKGVESDAATLAYYGLYALQHRGQDCAGISVSDGTTLNVHKGMGLISDVFSKDTLAALKGHISVGHVLYSTVGKKTIENAQPMVHSLKLGRIAVAHNGQLVNYAGLKEMLEEGGSTFSSSSDTEVILKLIARGYRKGLERALTDTIGMIKGSFALCVMTEKVLIGARDPNGIRPLCLGRLPKGWALASESCALDSIGATFVRDIQPGEIVVINEDGVLSFEYGERTSRRTCVFEYVYFARPDSIIDGIGVLDARLRMGAVLAEEAPVDADLVIGVPDSGLGAALGYARALGVPYSQGLVKNKYTGRSFIAPTQEAREAMVLVKLNAISSEVSGRRVVVIDDSIVRGTTSRRLVQILRRAGAKEVHFRVSSPPVKYPCYFGIDTPTKGELISSAHDVEEICKEIGADSLAFITVEGMFRAIRGENIAHKGNAGGYCKGCFTGEYPLAVPCELCSHRVDDSVIVSTFDVEV